VASKKVKNGIVNYELVGHARNIPSTFILRFKFWSMFNSNHDIYDTEKYSIIKNNDYLIYFLSFIDNDYL